MSNDRCCVCDCDDRELRPYGPGGASICYRCGTSPERVEQTRAAFGAILDRHDRLGVDTQLQSGAAPMPRIPRRAR
jgi:hypothetical protein